MLNVGASVEGKTERIFIEKVVAPYLRTLQIDITPISMDGSVSVERASSEISRICQGHSHVTTFYDFYGFSGKSSNDTKQSLEKKLEKAVGQPLRQKLIPHIQMHEFEGLLFSSPDSIAAVLDNVQLQSWADGILRQFNGRPEAINDSKSTAPSKRLESQKFVSYRKTVHGPDIAKHAGLGKLRATCPGFDEWMRKLEGLAPS